MNAAQGVDPSQNDERYGHILDQVHQKQQELQYARVIIQQLREDNEQLKSNFDVCKAQLIETRQKYNKAKEGLLAATEHQIRVDRKHESLVESWKAQLTARTEDLEALQAQLVPQDLDMLRIKVQEELEEPHQIAIAEKEGEIRKWEQLFYSVRREYEKLKVEQELFRDQTHAIILSDRTLYDAEVSELKRQLQDCEASRENKTAERDLLATQQALVTAQARQRQLLTEVNDVRAKHEASLRESQCELSAMCERLVKTESEQVMSEADAKKAQQQCRHVESRLSDLEHQNAALQEATRRASEDLEKASAASAAAEKLRAESARRSLRDSEQRRHTAETQLAQLESTRQKELRISQATVTAANRARELCEDRVQRALANEETTRAATRKAIEDSEKAAAKAKEELAQSMLEIETHQETTTHSLRRVEQALTDAVIEKTSKEREISLLRDRLSRSQSEHQSIISQKETFSKKADTEAKEAMKARERIRSLEEKTEELYLTEGTAKALVEQTQEDLTAVTKELSLQRANHEAALTSLTEQHRAEREAMAKSAKRSAEITKQRAAAAVRQEQKRSAKYKDAARTAHEKGKTVRRTLEALRNMQPGTNPEPSPI